MAGLVSGGEAPPRTLDSRAVAGGSITSLFARRVSEAPEATAILPGGGGTQKLARLVGRHRAMLLIMTGKMFGAAEAFGMGVVSEVTPAGQALARAIEVAREIAEMPAVSIMQVKEIINAGLNAPLDTALMLERKAFQLQFATRDQKEGMRAFLEKRKPKFEGQ